jgi:uncharacterized SAM-binding protein YcdF (DUF218 family)
MKVARRVLLVVLVLLVAYPTWLAYRIWDQTRHDEVHSADAIVVLGAAQYDGRPSAVFKARLDHAAYLYEQGLSDKVVVTGGKQEGDRFTEAEAGAKYLAEKHGIPAEHLVDVGEGNTTLESLEAVAQEVKAQGVDSVLLVSDPFHSERIKEMAHDLGFEGAYASWASYQMLNRSFPTKVKELLHEVASLAAYEILQR